MLFSLLGTILLLINCSGLEETWYRGCINGSHIGLSHEEGALGGDSVLADCTKHCHTRRFVNAGVQLIRSREIDTQLTDVDEHTSDNEIQLAERRAQYVEDGTQPAESVTQSAGVGAQSARNSTQSAGVGAQSARNSTQSAGVDAQSARNSTQSAGVGAQSARNSTQSAGVGAQSVIICACFNASSEIFPSLQSFNSCDESPQSYSKNELPMGISESSWAVYASEGPYLTTVAIEIDAAIAIVDKPVAIEIQVTRAAAINITEDSLDLGHWLDIIWTIEEDNARFHEHLSMRDFTQIFHRPKYIFTKPGNYAIDVEVSNGISSLEASLDITVVHPAPCDLQVRITDDVDLPSCLPEEFKVTENTGQVFAAFTDTLLHLESAVSIGTNLTFTFWFEDTAEVKVVEVCGSCTNVSIEHVFEKTGMFQVLTSVENIYGNQQKYITMLIIERQLNSLTIDVDPESSHLATTGQPVHFIVSLVTTSRSNRSLRVWYGDGHSDVVSLADTNSPRLVLAGNGKEMEIIASYGEGCRLLVDFQYVYEVEGLYRPKVAVFEDGLDISIDKVEEKKMIHVFNDYNKFELQFDENFGIIENSSIFRLDASEHETDKLNSDEPKLEIIGDLSGELEADILVLSEITSIRVYTSHVASCEEPLEIKSQIMSTLNVTFYWIIDRIIDNDALVQHNEDFYNVDEYSESVENSENDLVRIFDKNTTEAKLVYMFAHVGAYVVTVRASNAVSSLVGSIDVVVQCPIEGLVAKCSDEYIRTGAELICYARVLRGSNVIFHWSIEGIETKTYTQFENHTSTIGHRFKSSGIYDITLRAMNNISKSYFEVESAINVQDPIRSIKVVKKSPNLVGYLTKILAFYQPKCCELYNLAVEFDFDFGDGREYYPCNDQICFNSCNDRLCLGQAGYVFEQTGTHEVTVFAYNDVSEITLMVEVEIFNGLDNVTVLVVDMPTAGSPTRFMVMENGKTMETADVYFTWILHKDTEIYHTNSPLVDVCFPLPGNYTVFLNLTNPVETRGIEIPVIVRSRSEVNLELLHDLFVIPDNDVTFNLQGALIGGWIELRVNYSDGYSETHKGVTYQWNHTFYQVGTQQINVALVGTMGTTMETLTSYMMVQEPVTGLQLSGPTALAYQEYVSCTWTATTVTGTNVLYNWTLGDNILIPKSQYEIQIPRPGNYTVAVEAFNDVTKQPLSASLSFLVQHMIEDAHLEIVGNLVGKSTQIIVYVSDYHEFMVEIYYGDGGSEIVYSDDPVVMDTNDLDLKVYFTHIYELPGEYNVTVNVSNRVSAVVVTEMFIPIEDITLTTKSPWVIRITGHVVVRATVTGGSDLTFTWNFSDSRTYEETLITSYPNETIAAKHFYGMSGEYCVTFNVTGRNYPAPGVYAALDRCFLVVDPIDLVKLSSSSNSSALVGNSTSPVTFTARLSGSHVMFIFDYGDGMTQNVSGTQLSPWSQDMTMFAEGKHSFTAVGEYKVKVTAVNPLGNQTVQLPASFWVQEPPDDLQFCEWLRGERFTRYAGKVGELVTMCAHVKSGTDVMFDWKLGDQTDLVKKGALISHQYMSAGVRTVYVRARNKVHALARSVKVYINYEIQGVELVTESQVIAVDQEMYYTAVVTPDYPNIASNYQWTFKAPSRSQGRGRTIGGMKKYSSRQSTVPYTFLVPGECTATVTAYNAIGRVTSASVDIYVHEPIINSEIVVLGNTVDRLVNRPIRFMHYAYSGTDVNLTWTFGDGTHNVLTNMVEIEHVYTREGAYNITVLAKNPVSSQTVYKMLFILERSYCNEPGVNILNEAGIQILHSQYFTIEADVVTDCNLTSTAAYHWSIDGHVTTYAIEMQKRVLVLPPKMLIYGMHLIKFAVRMVGTIIYASRTTTIDVISTPLVSNIHGGVYRRLTYHNDIVIDGSASFDPDNEEKEHLMYDWKCSLISIDGKYVEGCFYGNVTQDASVNITNNASCSIAMDTAELKVPCDCLVTASNYTFELTVSAPGRQNGTSFQTITVENEDSLLLDVKIVRPYTMLDMVNADRKLSFYVDCGNCPPEGTSYQWTLKLLAGYNIYNYARAHDLSCVESDGQTYLLLLSNETETSTERLGSTWEPTEHQSIVQIMEGYTDGFIGEFESVTFDPDLDYDMTTTAPLFPFDVPIVEGKPGTDNRRRRSPSKSRDEYMRPEEQADNTRRTKSTLRKLDIVEEINPSAGRGVSRFPLPQIEEGTPGESGSSGGRQYFPFGPVEEDTGSERITVRDTENGDTGSGIEHLDKLEGSRKDPGRKLTILDMPMIPVALRDDKTKTRLGAESLVLTPGFLRQGLTYFLEVKVNNEEGGLHGEAVSSFVVNESPVHGRCSIKPDNGVELYTEFRVLCKAWQDKHKPLMYAISYNIDQSGDRKLMYRGVNHEFPIKLPSGKPENDYNVYVYIDILDGLLAKTSVCSISIRVTPRTLSDELGQERVLYTDAKLIYDEITSLDGALQQSVDGGNDAMSKVYIMYLASWLNKLTRSAGTLHQKTNSSVSYSIGISNATYINERIIGRQEDLVYRRDARRELLKLLEHLPVRDEAEVIQSAQALAFTTAVSDELDLRALDLSLKVLKSICSGVRKVYKDVLIPTGELVQLAVAAASSIIIGTMGVARGGDETLEVYMYKQMIQEAISSMEQLILNELKFHIVLEEPIISSTDYLSVWASRHSTADNHTLSIGNTKFKIPSGLGSSLGSSIARKQTGQSANQRCMQIHMTSFKMNPYSLQKKTKVHSVVGGLMLYDCEGRPILVNNLQPEKQIQVDLPNILPKAVVFEDLLLQKWAMNIHQFNVTSDDLQHALHFRIDLIRVQAGRLFPVTVLLSFTAPPSPDFYKFKYDFEAGNNNVDIFLPPASFNATGMYYLGIVDSTYNSGRLRRGEVTQRNYTFKLWWDQCLYWNGGKEAWLPDGCAISHNSTFEVTKCTCDHLTSFGGRFELIPNKLTVTDIEGFFSLHRNPVTLTLVSVALVMYCLLLFWCYHADVHDNRKGGIVYLLDNSPVDQQKFEITVDTGFWHGAGTTAKISIILHGEEGMSETRELISEDDRPMFERNSRDKFILSLPDSIGRIWKVQIWHNNFGPSPSWYLSRVIVRDLNTGVQYMFICEKWLAVEEQDGKVEREFMVLDGPLQFGKAYSSKAVEYMADFHIWMSLVTCPPYNGFMRTERLSVCLTMFMSYMCLNAVWYKTSHTEYRGEFGLLDVSWKSLTVGAVCCALAIPLGRLLEFLFRRSKPKHASSCHTKDDVSDWEPDYPAGKPNEQESEDTSEQVQPIMTYSLLDQSILNWPNIQSWAQKQWMKRQVTGRSTHDLHSGNSSSHSGQQNGSSGSSSRPGVNPGDLAALHGHGVPELDQASSGFEDCNSLIRPKASVDSTHTTAAPSVNESTRVHKPQSLPDSLRISTKLPSESDYEQSGKAPSISSVGSNKSSVLQDRKSRRILNHVYLPYWCRYIAWILCAVVCVCCGTVTIMYGYRFGTTSSTLWLQSLYFSMMISLFISNPLLIVLGICCYVWIYKKDPNSVDSYGYDIFNQEKAKEDLLQWKKQLEAWDDGKALERGVAARQRSRYLRFARPPQEKQLIEARKRVIKQKKALSIFRESVAFAASLILLVMAYSKDSTPNYHLNVAVKNVLLKSGDVTFTEIKSMTDWYTWAETSLLDAMDSYNKLHDKNTSSTVLGNTYMIGQVQLRQQRIQEIACPEQLPYVFTSCLGNRVAMDTGTFGNVPGVSYTDGFHGDFIFGRQAVYDGAGYILSLNNSRFDSYKQLQSLKNLRWLDRRTRAVFVEMTLYNTPTNLFTAVKLLAEMSQTGVVCTTVKVTSSQLFRYVTWLDIILLVCELAFFMLMILSVKTQALKLLYENKEYFCSLWNILNFLVAAVSMFFCGCFIYRFVIISECVESLRSTYYERYVSVSFIAFWDELLRSSVAILVFLCFTKCLRLFRFNKQFAVIGEVYRKSRWEMLMFFAMFCIILAAYSSTGHVLFGSLLMTFRDPWSSLLGVTAIMTGSYHMPEVQGQTIAANVYLFTLCVFGIGFLTSYMIAVLSHYFKTRKRRRLLAMGGKEAILFYWYQFQLWSGVQKPRIEEEPVVILPPEFTMAEIEYQVDELLFRMNALTGSHGLPEKPSCYLTDSDCTYGGGDDGISSAGSEPGVGYIDDRLEQRVQKIEDNLCSKEPFLAQLLKFDSLGAEDLSQEREKQLRSHLELEIFRQLQIQRQDLRSPTEDNVNSTVAAVEGGQTAPHSPGQCSTSSDELSQKQTLAAKPTRRTRSSLKVQTIQDLIAKTTQEFVESRDNSSSNPDSPQDKISFAKTPRPIDASKKSPTKQNSISSSSEKISPDLSLTHTNSLEMEHIKKPTKPTFLHSRESSLLECPKGSPIMKLRTACSEKGLRSDINPLGLPESSSGSEQDSLQIGKKLFGRRSLRKTKSRGKGKGPDSLEPALALDEVEGEEAESYKMEENLVDTPPSEQDNHSKGSNNEKCAVKAHVVTADVHHTND